MATLARTTTPWTITRAALEESTARFSSLLRASDSSIRAVGTWSVGETAAHLLAVSVFDSAVVAGTELIPELEGFADQARSTAVDGVGEMNRQILERITERDLVVLAARIEGVVDKLLSSSASKGGGGRVEWLGGLELTETGVVAHLVSELLVHGHDIATAQRLPWSVPSEHAALTFEHFLVDLLRRNGDRIELDSEPDAVRCEFRVRGCRRVVFATGNRRVNVEEPGARVDLRVTADGAALLLVMYKRISPLGPALRGRIRVGGRRPWRLGRLMKAMKLP